MAPEQLQGRDADARSDIFSFGLVLYELLTGQRAFAAENPASLIAAILTAQPPSVGKLLPLAPPALDRALQRMLAKDPDDRWQSVRDLQAELEWIAGSPVSAIPAAKGRAAWFGWTVAAAVTIAGAALAWIHWNEKPQLAPLVRFTVDPPPGERFSQFSSPVVSPDGQKILFGVAAQSPGAPHLRMHRISSGESAPFQSLLPFPDPTWSPDGNSFAAYKGDSLVRIDLATGAHTEILREQIYDFRWGPAGSYLFGVREKGLFIAASGSGRRQLTVQKSDEGLHVNPVALPDAKSFLFEKRRTDQVETWLARLDGGNPKLLLTKTSQALYAPPGYLLYLQGDSLLAQGFDASRGTLTGDARTIVTGIGRSIYSVGGFFSVSDNGVLVFRQGSVTSPSRLTWLDRRGNAIGTLGEVADYTNPALSPDGQRLAVCIRDSTGKRDIWVIDLARGMKTRVTFDPADETNPAWSPDGSEIAYSSDRNGRRDMYARSSSGTGQARVLLESSEDKSVLDWSGDGKSLFYSVPNPKTTGHDFWILPMAGPQRTPALFVGGPFRVDMAMVAPDSRSVLYRMKAAGSNCTLSRCRRTERSGRFRIRRRSARPNGAAMAGNSFMFPALTCWRSMFPWLAPRSNPDLPSCYFICRPCEHREENVSSFLAMASDSS